MFFQVEMEIKQLAINDAELEACRRVSIHTAVVSSLVTATGHSDKRL